MQVLRASRLFSVQNARMASTVAGSILEASKWLPYKNAIKCVEEKVHFNYKDLINNSRCFANGLYEMGLKPGDSLAVWTDNTSENVVAYYACAMSGIKMVSIDPSLSKDSQLSDILLEAEPKALLYSPSLDATVSNRDTIISSLFPSVKDAADLIMKSPIKSRKYRKITRIMTTSFDHPTLNGVINFRSTLVNTPFPDFLTKVTPRLEQEPERPLFVSYSVENDKVQASPVYTQSQIVTEANKISEASKLTPDVSVLIASSLHKDSTIIDITSALINSSNIVIPSKATIPSKVSSMAEQEKCTVILGEN